MKKTTPSLNIFTRFVAIWKPSYLKETLHEEKVGGVWGFWFFWNTIIALVASIVIGWFANKAIVEHEPTLWAEVPAFNFVFKDHILVETGLEEPYRQDLGDDDTGDQLSFIIDRSGEKYDRSSLEVLDNAILVTVDKVIIKNQDKREWKELPYTDVDELKDMTFDKEQAHTWVQKILPVLKKFVYVGIFIGLWVFICLLRLVSLLWWSFLAWLAGKATGTQGFTFGRAYLFLMGTSIIPLLIEAALLATGLMIGFSTFLFVGIITGMNLYEMKKS